MADFAPGMRVIIRCEEWMAKKCETNSLGNQTLQCVVMSPEKNAPPARKRKRCWMIYSVQFPTLQKNEQQTWYDATGKVVFTINTALPGVGFDRPTFEKPNVITPVERGTAPWNGIMKDAPAGYVFERTITDDTQPGGPVERTIRYVAPFDRCDRENDYETAWAYFSKQQG